MTKTMMKMAYRPVKCRTGNVDQYFPLQFQVKVEVLRRHVMIETSRVLIIGILNLSNGKSACVDR